MHYFIKADGFLLEHEETGEGYLEIDNGKFGSFSETLPEHKQIIDYSGFLVAPGLFDTHIHGIKSHDVMDGSLESVKNISEELAKLGVTSFLPTTLTSSDQNLEEALSALKAAFQEGLPGAVSEGVFLEGPYFTEKYKGAQNGDYFRDPNFHEFEKWQGLADGTIVKIALAPEREGAYDFINRVTSTGVHVSIGHSDATFETCKTAIQNGADNFVHLFNGMRGMHHREPGVVGTALRSKETFSELICDGHHLHPEMASLTSEVLGDRIVLITDCMRAGRMPDGTYALGEYQVIMENGVARTDTGSLAGSTLELKEGVRNLMKWTGKELKDAWHHGSLSPAMSMGIDDRIGSITEGKTANFTVLDKDLVIQATAVSGRFVYENKE